MKLTEHFTLEELVASDYAKRNRIKNEPTAEVVENLRILCERVLEPARVAYGAPITITSGYRGAVLNRCVGGAKTSQHLYGQAADLQCKDMQKLFEIIRQQGNFDQLLYERSKSSTWVHVSFNKSGNRKVYNANYKV